MGPAPAIALYRPSLSPTTTREACMAAPMSWTAWPMKALSFDSSRAGVRFGVAIGLLHCRHRGDARRWRCRTDNADRAQLQRHLSCSAAMKKARGKVFGMGRQQLPALRIPLQTPVISRIGLAP